VVTEDNLRAATSDRDFARGTADFGYRPVAKLVVREATLNARVAGGDDCDVQRRNKRGVPGHSCTCPLGGDRRSSKNAAAAGLVWLAQAGGWTENLCFDYRGTRERGHRVGATDISRGRHDGVIARRDNRAYDDSAALLNNIRIVMRRVVQAPDFAVWTGAACTRHKAKRGFKRGWEYAEIKGSQPLRRAVG
jgi:hypothetical protein